MSEYAFVEKPLLNQRTSMGWQVIDQGEGVPKNPTAEQLCRYADVREDAIAAGLREGEPRLFFSNQLMIATYGEDCRVGSITSSEEFYNQWRSIDLSPKLSTMTRMRFPSNLTQRRSQHEEVMFYRCADYQGYQGT